MRFLTIFWNMVPVPQVSQQFWAQHQKKKHRTRALSCQSNLITVLQRKLTQRHTDTHTHTRSTAQHGTAHLFRGNCELHRRQRNRRTCALSWQSLLHDSPHTETHTRTTRTHTDTEQTAHTHTRAGAPICTGTDTHTHTVMVRFRCAIAVFFSVCNSTLERTA